MFDVDESDQFRAERIAEGLFADEMVDEFLQTEVLGGQRFGVVISDVEKDVEEFRRDLHMADLDHIGLPALYGEKDRDPIPVVLSAFVSEGQSDSWLRFALKEFRPWWRQEWLFEAIRQSNSEVEILDLEQADDIAKRGVVDHLAARFAAFRHFIAGDWRPDSLLKMRQRRSSSPVIFTPGANVLVTSSSSGLRVHWSGAFCIAANYFGAPTTPVTGVLQAGRYVFGIDGGAYGSTIHWDQNAVVTLPGANNVHLQY